jgi:predicted membrane protein
MLKKLLTWAVVAFMIFFVAFRPDSAAEVVKSLGAGVMDIAQGFGDFFTSLVA